MKYTKEQILELARKVHGDKFEYLLDFNNVHDTMTIICPIHGAFKQEVRRHLQGFGCKKCSNKALLSNEYIINELKKVYGDRFDYSKVKYEGRKKKITLTCKEHGDFQIWPYPPFPTNPCPKCGSKLYTTEECIKRFKEVHGDKYIYNKTIYKSSNKKLLITCPIHGDFEQTPYAHLKGQGCPFCNCSKLENEIKQLLIKNNIEFEQQKHFKWLGRMSLDFYLPKYNIAIECQGEQHFKAFDFFGGETKFVSGQQRDIEKKKLCEENNVTLLYFSHTKYNENIITDLNEILNIIQAWKT